MELWWQPGTFNPSINHYNKKIQIVTKPFFSFLVLNVLWYIFVFLFFFPFYFPFHPLNLVLWFFLLLSHSLAEVHTSYMPLRLMYGTVGTLCLALHSAGLNLPPSWRSGNRSSISVSDGIWFKDTVFIYVEAEKKGGGVLRKSRKLESLIPTLCDSEDLFFLNVSSISRFNNA